MCRSLIDHHVHIPANICSIIIYMYSTEISDSQKIAIVLIAKDNVVLGMKSLKIRGKDGVQTRAVHVHLLSS